MNIKLRVIDYMLIFKAMEVLRSTTENCFFLKSEWPRQWLRRLIWARVTLWSHVKRRERNQVYALLSGEKRALKRKVWNMEWGQTGTKVERFTFTWLWYFVVSDLSEELNFSRWAGKKWDYKIIESENRDNMCRLLLKNLVIAGNRNLYFLLFSRLLIRETSH